jgi:hypothetical protein
MISFGIIGFAFVGLGAVFLGFSESVVEIQKEYDNLVPVGNAGFVEIPITETMRGPIFVYYELSNFYQNHRRYVASRDDDQLAAGDTVSTGVSDYETNCDPWYKSTYESSAKVSTDYQTYPCGLVARSVFNDTFILNVKKAGSNDNQQLVIDDSPSTISWPQDVNDKFHQANPLHVTSAGITLLETLDMWLIKTFPPQICLPNSPDVAPILHAVATRELATGMRVADCDFNQNTCNFDPACMGSFSPVPNNAGYGINNAHFINWMRTAGLSTFRKLYGKVETNLEVGDTIRVGVQSNFEVQSYQGTKSVVLSTTTWMGGKNGFIGITYIVIGCLSLIFTAVFAWLHFKNPRRLMDIDYLDWGGDQ